MAHELEIVDGMASAMYALKPAWHGLGQTLDHVPTSREAITVANLNRHIEMRQVQNDLGHEIPGWFQTCYADNPKFTLGMVSDRYKVIQNIEAFQFLDSLVADGDMKYEAAGALDFGRKIWILGRLPSYDEIAEGDNSLRYVLFYNSHDGKSSLQILPTSVRAVCANTIAIALRNSGKGISHKGEMREKLSLAKRYISQFDESFTLFRDSARLLATRKYNPTDAKEYIEQLFPILPEMEGTKAEARALNNRTECRRMFRDGSNQLPSIKGTWWQLLNSVTGMVDHDTRKESATIIKAEKRFESLIEGTGNILKQKALQLALDMSA